MRKVLNVLLTLGVVFSFSACELPFGFGEDNEEIVEVASLYSEDYKMWENIFDTEEESESKSESYEFDSRPLGVILPQQMINPTEFANFYEALYKVADPDVIFIIGGNNSGVGVSNIQTCSNCVFTTTKGDVEINKDLSEDLINNSIATSNDQFFIKDTSISTHTPFIENYFPNAEIVPIIFDWKTPLDKVSKLTDWIDKNLPDDGLVIASTDFSTYLPAEIADFHDQSSFATISNFDFNNIYDLEIGSPSSIYALLKLMEKRGYTEAERFEHINSARFVDEHVEETTSNQFFAFFEDEIDPVEGVSILSFGNMPSDNTLAFSTGWEWDRNYVERDDRSTTKLLRDVKGAEDRFLVGSDFLVFDLVEGECAIEEQNGMEVAFCKFVEDENREDEYLDLVREKSKESDLVYLLFEFQNEGEMDKNRTKLVKSFAKKGVDIFVGRGLPEVIPFERYSGSLLFYSLGDFITDNKLAIDMNATSSGVALGLYVTPKYYHIYMFPVYVKNGYPSLIDFSERASFFSWFTEEASLSSRTKPDVYKGYFSIKR